MTKRKPGAVRGRPPTGRRRRQIAVRIDPDLVDRIDAHCAREGTDRTAAIRPLLESAFPPMGNPNDKPD